MTTRITYKKLGNNYYSPKYINYHGDSYNVVLIKSDGRTYTVLVRCNNKNVKAVQCPTIQSAKRTARKLLLNDYEIRMNEEVRI